MSPIHLLDASFQSRFGGAVSFFLTSSFFWLWIEPSPLRSFGYSKNKKVKQTWLFKKIKVEKLQELTQFSFYIL